MAGKILRSSSSERCRDAHAAARIGSLMRGADMIRIARTMAKRRLAGIVALVVW